ncbi:hypothetical protein BH11PSE11_BH11PSE11_30790 [soil metagenome]
MSLLMQALKKAENAKQKQGESGAASAEQKPSKAPDEALTLSPKDPVIDTPAKAPAADDTQVSPNPFGAPQMSGAGLSDEIAPALLPVDPIPFEASPDLPPLPVSAQPPIAEPYVPQAPLAKTFSEPAPVAAQDPITAARHVAEAPAAPIAERANPSDRIPVRAPMPKIDPEQHQAVLQAGKNVTSEKQKKAQSVFAAKHLSGRRPTFLISVVGVTAVMVLAGLGYVYWQITGPAPVAFVPMAVNVPPQPLPIPAEPAVPTQTVAGEIPPPAPVQASPVVVTTPAQAVVVPASVPVVAVIPRPDVVQTAPARPPATPAAVTVASVSAVPSATAPPAVSAPGALSAPTFAAALKARSEQSVHAAESNAIKIRQTTVGNEINPALSSAYQAYTAGDTNAASAQYKKVLQQEPNNRDALLGLAAIALNQRKAEQAGAFYSRMLELDPADADAIAGLTTLQQGDPAQSESRLKKVLAQDQQSGAALFALGNLYSQQSRWAEAQQTFFRAYTTAPDNPDYAFNLAVSLDRLNQAKLAEEYYQRALTLGQKSAGNFSRKSVLNRIKDLQSSVEN